MKNFIKISILLLLFLLTLQYRKPITNFIVEKFIFKRGVIIDDANPYRLAYTFHYVQETDDFFAKDKKQLLNIFYTALNRGLDSFYFYCNYEECEEDVTKLIEQNEMNDINNFLNPYNTYRKLKVAIDSLRKITVNVEKFYTEEDITNIENKLNEIMLNSLDDSMSINQKIKIFHDYIIHNTQYDQEYIDKNLNDITSPSHKAVGPLFYGKALCGGYTEVMSIFLNKLGIPNYRISSAKHIWNLVNIDNNWLHIDLTWDDPSIKEDLVLDLFLLISTNKLYSYNTDRHLFNEDIYMEAKINPQEEM